MRRYKREFFDQCLFAIASEFQRVERESPEWPDDMAAGAQIVCDKTERLLSASKNNTAENKNAHRRFFREAVETGAIVLRLLLNTYTESAYARQPSDWREEEYHGLD